MSKRIIMLSGGHDGLGPEDMKTPEQSEREQARVRRIVLRRLGTPRPGEEVQNEMIAEIYARDICNQLAAEGVMIPESVECKPEEDRLILCALSDSTERTKGDITEKVNAIVNGKMYGIKLKLTGQRTEELIRIAILYSVTSARIEKGWDASMFAVEETEADSAGEYQAE